jgi:hypothetical protein
VAVFGLVDFHSPGSQVVGDGCLQELIVLYEENSQVSGADVGHHHK